VEGEGGEGGILEPETANSYEAGVKTELLGRRLRVELAGFLSDLDNMVVSQSIGGLPALANVGQVRLKGLELSVVDRVGENLYSAGSYGLHDARFRDYLTQFDGVPTQLDGNRFEMSPHHLAALGVSWSPAEGLLRLGRAQLRRAAATSTSATPRSPSRTRRSRRSSAGATGRYELRLSGRNLTDQRDPGRGERARRRAVLPALPAALRAGGAPSASSRRYGRTCSSTAKSPGFQAWAMT
jgi:outer membrane receptor protein involved in Fe transport